MIAEHFSLTIQQAAEQTGLSEYTLRYYERIRLLHPVERAANGHRRYDSQHLRLIRFVVCLRDTGMSLDQIRAYVDLVRDGSGNEQERLQLLLEHRAQVVAQMQALAENLAVIDRKIDQYKEYTICSKDG